MASAQTLTGTVKNATTGKPAAGDEIILIKLGQGMEEAGHTKADANGKFSFKLEDAQTPHLIRAIHQDVTYHRMAPPGSTTVEVDVNDVAKKVDGIKVVADIMRVQAQKNELEVVREFGVQNASTPPRTEMNEKSLEFYLPDGAEIFPDSATAVTENGNPLKTSPIQEGEKNRYAFNFPLRPGLTRFEVAYKLTYSGSANLNPRSVYPLDHFVVMVPKAMQFTPASADAGFKLVDYPNEPSAAVQVASSTKLGGNLAFKISGEGVLEDGQQAGAGTQGEQTSPPGSEAGNAQAPRPGGGLGPPIDAPDPLQRYRWWILGGFAAILILGGIYVASQQQSAARAMRRGIPPTDAAFLEDEYKTEVAPSVRSGSKLMEGIKEELFQLELERRQGEISQSEYEQAKAALDQTLDRALKREAQKA